MRQMPLYTNIHGRMIVYWLSNIGVSSRQIHSSQEHMIFVLT